jgi:hypothetical protein
VRKTPVCAWEYHSMKWDVKSLEQKTNGRERGRYWQCCAGWKRSLGSSQPQFGLLNFPL